MRTLERHRGHAMPEGATGGGLRARASSGPRGVIAAAVVMLAVATGLGFSRPADATTVHTPEHQKYLDRVAWLLEDGGRWSAENPSYDAQREGSIRSFGYAYSEGYAPGVIRLKITGRAGDKNYLFWDGFYYWHPVRNNMEYVSQGTGGAIARGASVDPEFTLVFEVITPDGKVELHRDEERRNGDDEFTSIGLRYGEEGWKEQQRLTWRRVKEGEPRE